VWPSPRTSRHESTSSASASVSRVSPACSTECRAWCLVARDRRRGEVIVGERGVVAGPGQGRGRGIFGTAAFVDAHVDAVQVLAVLGRSKLGLSAQRQIPRHTTLVSIRALEYTRSPRPSGKVHSQPISASTRWPLGYQSGYHKPRSPPELPPPPIDTTLAGRSAWQATAAFFWCVSSVLEAGVVARKMSRRKFYGTKT
jgi:hypothetical protein